MLVVVLLLAVLVLVEGVLVSALVLHWRCSPPPDPLCLLILLHPFANGTNPTLYCACFPARNCTFNTSVVFSVRYMYTVRAKVSECIFRSSFRFPRPPEGIKSTIYFYCNTRKYVLSAHYVGGVSSRSTRSGTPSRKRCAVNGQMT